MDLYIPRSPGDYAAAIFRRKKSFAVPFFSLLALTWAAFPYLPRAYEASVTMLMEENSFTNPASAGKEKDQPAEPKLEQQVRILSADFLSFPNMEKLVRDKTVGLGDPSLSPAQVEDLSKTFGLTLPEHGHE